MYLRDKLSLHETTQRTGLSRNTVHVQSEMPSTMG